MRGNETKHLRWMMACHHLTVGDGKSHIYWWITVTDLCTKEMETKTSKNYLKTSEDQGGLTVMDFPYWTYLEQKGSEKDKLSHRALFVVVRSYCRSALSVLAENMAGQLLLSLKQKTEEPNAKIFYSFLLWYLADNVICNFIFFQICRIRLNIANFKIISKGQRS